MAQAPSTQITASVAGSALAKLEKQIRKRVGDAMQKREAELERLGDAAAEQIVAAIAMGGGNVRVAGRSFSVTGVQSIEIGPIARLLRDDAYLGEIGIPDPQDAVNQLKRTIPMAVTFRTRVFRGTIRISARFNPVRLLKLNPHPGKMMNNGYKIPVSSWLQWTTGPKFDSKGTPGYGVARVGEILAELDNLSVRKQNRAIGIASASRTFRAAGSEAGVMLRIRSINPRATQSPFEAFTGRKGQPWRPVPPGMNFWTDWWKRNVPAMKRAFTSAAQALMQRVATQELGGVR